MVHANEDSRVNWIEQLCLSTWKSVYRLIYFKVQNREEAEDITQETWWDMILPHNVHRDEY
ncbi:hypothetical protein LR69_00703 [Geobacillus sp. BCO2]|nr:hypothetical protein LR69_00703 [Geobacillus sp. BCO2]